jgi:hypothetical protein
MSFYSLTIHCFIDEQCFILWVFQFVSLFSTKICLDYFKKKFLPLPEMAREWNPRSQEDMQQCEGVKSPCTMEN